MTSLLTSPKGRNRVYPGLVIMIIKGDNEMKLFKRDQIESSKKTVVCLSAERSHLSDSQNVSQTEQLKNDLNALNIPFKSAKGCYKGEKESSFVCVSNNANQFLDLFELGIKYKQESILARFEDGVFLYYCNTSHIGDTRIEKIGDKIKQVPEYKALKYDAYTILNDKCYIVV